MLDVLEIFSTNHTRFSHVYIRLLAYCNLTKLMQKPIYN